MSLELANILLDEIYIAIENSEDLGGYFSEIAFSPKQNMRLPGLYIACTQIKPLTKGRGKFYQLTIKLEVFSRLGDQHHNISISNKLAKFLTELDLNLGNYITVGKSLQNASGDLARDISTNKFTTEYQYLFKEVLLQ